MPSAFAIGGRVLPDCAWAGSLVLHEFCTLGYTGAFPLRNLVLLRPQHYGSYSNVNPNEDHPRWSQATERRIGDGGLFTPKRKTLMFNGYNEVASLYSGMDLKKYY